jgi:GNAT superfamily N-acetyltransferase
MNGAIRCKPPPWLTSQTRHQKIAANEVFPSRGLVSDLCNYRLCSLGCMSDSVAQSVCVAPATPADCHDCARLLVDQLGEHGIEASLRPLTQVLVSVVADASRGFLLLARDKDRIVGVAYVATILSAEHCGPIAWLEELYVTPDSRGRGVGTALLAAVVERSRETGMVAMELEVDAGHKRAESLYKRFGFRSLDRSRWVRKLAT